MKTPLVFNIQNYSIHDGDGIRTTLFFKGCPLRCKWCHNPESQHFYKELITYKSKCVGCGRCVPKCPNGCITVVDGKAETDRSRCTVCGTCEAACLKEAREVAGKEYSIQELYKKAVRDAMFFEQSGGGVTLSGGEVMCTDSDFLEALLKKLYRDGISVFIDTCAHVPYEKFERILPYVDVFMIDIKAMDPEVHKKFIGVDNHLILENIVKLSDAGAKIYIRMPIIGGVNSSDAYIESVIDYLRGNHVHPAQINLLPYHDIGKGKYANLDLGYDSDSMSVPSNDTMVHYQAMFEEKGFQNVKIGG